MSKKAPLYAWQQDVKQTQDKNLQDFLNNDFKKKEFRNKYISNMEIKAIAEKYDLDLSDLTRIINKHNQEFIEIEKMNILNEFNSFLSSKTDYIYNKREIERKFKKDYCDFYNELDMEEKIDAHNKNITSERTRIRFKEYEMKLNNSKDNRKRFRNINYYNDNKSSEYKTDIHKFFR